VLQPFECFGTGLLPIQKNLKPKCQFSISYRKHKRGRELGWEKELGFNRTLKKLSSTVAKQFSIYTLCHCAVTLQARKERKD
jgi:hypothetical protein